MLSRLITSKTRVKVLTHFLTHPDERFYYKNLITRLDVPPSVLQSELKMFEEIGLLESKREANVKFYWVNKKFCLYPELKGIIFKTVGLADSLKKATSKIGNIDVAFIYGSVAKNEEEAHSDIDLMVIGDTDIGVLYNALNRVEGALAREVNPTVFGLDEWQERVAKKNSFVMDVLRNAKIFVIGDEEKLEELSYTESPDEDVDDPETEKALRESQKQHKQGDVGTEEDVFNILRGTSKE